MSSANGSLKSDAENEAIRREVEIVRHKYPHYIPIIVRGRDKLELSKTKYLVTGDVTVSQFMCILRKKIEVSNGSKVECKHGLFLFVNNRLPSSTTLMSCLYENEKDPQTGMLFITLCKENTFG